MQAGSSKVLIFRQQPIAVLNHSPIEREALEGERENNQREKRAGMGNTGDTISQHNQPD